eukprot:3026999-Amphidinium_carterae.1
MSIQLWAPRKHCCWHEESACTLPECARHVLMSLTPPLMQFVASHGWQCRQIRRAWRCVVRPLSPAQLAC